VLDKVGPFERAIDGRGEDADLYFRIEQARFEAWYIPTAVVHHLTPAERLAEDYLLRVARIAGQGEAVRQRARLGLVRFAGLWLVRRLKFPMVQYPAWIWARLMRDAERTLGRRCDLAMAQGFIDGVKPAPPRPPVQPAAAPRVALAAAPARAAAPQQRAAPVYILRTGEPTVVMDIPSAVLGSPAVKYPSH
jgi:hypothetical protein